MKKVFFVLFVAVLLTPFMVLAQDNKTVQECAMPDGKTLTFESTEGVPITGEEAIKSCEAQKEPKELLLQKAFIMEMIRNRTLSPTDNEYTKNEIERLIRSVIQSESDRRMSRLKINPAMVR